MELKFWYNPRGYEIPDGLKIQEGSVAGSLERAIGYDGRFRPDYLWENDELRLVLKKNARFGCADLAKGKHLITTIGYEVKSGMYCFNISPG